MIPAEDLQCLKAIALLGGCSSPVIVSSQTIGEMLDISPQTAARRLKALESSGHIRRSIIPDGQEVSVTPAGVAELRLEYLDYCRIFSGKKGDITLEGSVVSGIGEGKYYMSLEPYRQQFKTHLGFEPFPGTLNIRLTPSSISTRKMAETCSWIRIKGFSTDGRTFGDARCLPCRIGDTPCAIIVPGRAHYPDDIIEVIAPIALRRKLGVEDNDAVRVEVKE
jgi:riboflavin kinase